MICGSRTDTMPLSRLRYVPAAARDEAVGAIGIMIPADRAWTRSDDMLLLSLGRTLAVAVERFISEARSRRAVLELESDRLGGILLDTVSHELRTPLTTITGSISALRDDALAEDPASRRELIDGALEASERLNGIVENLLSLSRIESGMMRLTRRSTDLEEIARAAIDGIGSPQSAPFPRRDAARSREIRVSIPHEARSASLDTALVGRLVANLLRNAAGYSPEGSPIDLAFEESGADLAIRVRDRGRGVPEGELEAIFEKFRRGSATPASTGGLGLGLAICRGIAKAHGGYITARNAPGGGLEVTAAFPSCVAGKDA
jgi:two-component system sensor histidine kinase KdpD